MTPTEIRADLILLHAPSVFDFRERRDVLFPYVASDSVAVSPVFEIYPLGFRSLEHYLTRRGHSVRIINLAALMLQDRNLDVPAFLRTLKARVFGIDLHWVIHAHGSLALAKLLKQLHPDTPVMFGGISSTYYADELIEMPQVDMVLRGHDTHAPADLLLQSLKAGSDLRGVPNLLFKDDRGHSKRNAFDHVPAAFGEDTAADWSGFLQARPDTNPALMVLPSAGCKHDCGWCGGSRGAARRIFRSERGVIPRDPAAIEAEMASMAGFPAAQRASIYTLNAYNFGREGMDAYLRGIAAAGIPQVSYEQFQLTPPDLLQRMVAAAATSINLSPESHDPEIGRLAGRGVYSNGEMEDWIGEALKIGVKHVYVWYFIGMPGQSRESVFDTVRYCGELLEKFPSGDVTPLLTPMVPFLDPGSRFFEHPREAGYNVYFRTLEEHRQALVNPSWVQRLNYDTDHLPRRELAEVSYDGTRAMLEMRRDVRALGRGIANECLGRLERERELVFEVTETYESQGRGAVVAKHGDAIAAHNIEALYQGVADQVFPIPRTLDHRWFDEFEIPRGS